MALEEDISALTELVQSMLAESGEVGLLVWSQHWEIGDPSMCSRSPMAWRW